MKKTIVIASVLLAVLIGLVVFAAVGGLFLKRFTRGLTVAGGPGSVAQPDVPAPEAAGPRELTTEGVWGGAAGQTADAGMEPAAAGKRAHEQSALIALADARVLMVRREFADASRLVRQAMRDYADTDLVKDFSDLYTKSEQELAVGRQSEEAAQAQQQARTQEELKAQHERFIGYRDEGQGQFNRGEFPAAIISFQNALTEEDDPEVRALLEAAQAKTRKPRIAVYDFAVTGEVGIPDAGRSVAELLLTKLDQQRFDLVERSRLSTILDEHDLAIAQIVDDPSVLKGKKIAGVQFLVVGTVVRLGTLAVSARVVDVVSGMIYATGEVSALDAVGLQMALVELAAVLQMSPEEKAEYLERRRLEQEELASLQADQVQRERIRQEEIRRQQEWLAAQQQTLLRRRQTGVTVLTEIRLLFDRGELEQVIIRTRLAASEYGDLPDGRQFVDLLAQAEVRLAALRAERARLAAEDMARRETQRRHQLFLTLRDRGRALMDAQDYAAALVAFRDALSAEENAEARLWLIQVYQKLSKPGLAVLDFTVADGLSVGSGQVVATAVLSRFDGSRFMPMERSLLAAILQANNLTMARLQANPLLLRGGQKLGGLRYLVVGKVAKASPLTVSAKMYDLSTGQVDSSSEVIVGQTRSFNDALSEAVLALEMSPAQRQAFAAAQQKLRQLLDKAKALAGEGKWRQALEAYQQAQDFRPTLEGKAGLELARTKLADDRGRDRDRQDPFPKNRHERFVKFRDEGLAAMKAQDHRAAAVAFGYALQQEENAEVRRLLGQAVGSTGVPPVPPRPTGETPVLPFDQLMANARAAAKDQKWREALDFYQRAYDLKPAQEAKDGAAQAQKMLAQANDKAKEEQAKLDGLLSKARAAAKAGRWQQALDFFQQANDVKSTQEAKDGVALAKQKLAEAKDKDDQDKAKLEDLLSKARAAAAASKWRQALTFYERANELKPNQEARDGVELAQKRLAEGTEGPDAKEPKDPKEPKEPDKPKAGDKQQQYNAAVAAARTALNKKDFRTAGEQIAAALALVGDGAEAKVLLERLGPVLVVTAQLEGEDFSGATVSLDGVEQKDTTPAVFRLKEGKSYKIEVSIPPQKGKKYAPVRKAIDSAQPGLVELKAAFKPSA